MRTAIPRQFGFSHCFACGPDNLRGLRLEFEREGDRVLTTFTPPPEYGGYGVILHGGLTSTLLDEVMAWAVYGLLDRLSLTTALRVNFLGPVRCGEPLTVIGSIVSKDDQGAEAQAELRDAAGLLRAEGFATMRFLSARAAARMGRVRPPQ
ncbi:MAG: PaaI family thioesterase [Deltaproteobacteria bacterium]|nr:PaaI family thioesterase [Deltaproteobacteria bacterium]